MVVSAENPLTSSPSAPIGTTEKRPQPFKSTPGQHCEVTAANACDTLTKVFEVTLDANARCTFPMLTPDNDGANDLFRPVLGCEPDSCLLEVFNTWGELIFATDDPETGWFGQVEEDLHPRIIQGISHAQTSPLADRWNSRTKKIRYHRRALNFKGTST